MLDPSRRYLLSPDLGADIVRVFRLANGTGTLTEAEGGTLQMKLGTGARHVAFWRAGGGNYTAGGKAGGARGQRVVRREEHGGRRRHGRGEGEPGRLFMYVVGELANTITAYAVSYPAAGGMAFREVGAVDTFGGKGVPAGAAAAEIAVAVCVPFRSLPLWVQLASWLWAKSFTRDPMDGLPCPHARARTTGNSDPD